MSRKRKNTDSLELTWDVTYSGLACVFDQMAEQYSRLAAENPLAAVELASRAAGLRDAAQTTRGLATTAGVA